MIRVIDTYPLVADLFEDGRFIFERWERYINSIYEDSASVFVDDMRQMCGEGFTFEDSILPLLNAVSDAEQCKKLHSSFLAVTEKLDEKVCRCFGRGIDCDVVLYLGLCNGAGWVTQINGRATVLLGIEKILELGWYEPEAMYGLVYHELGHIWHSCYGQHEQDIADGRLSFVWQLFSEGVAMCFEQELVGDRDFYRQDTDGWKIWCESNFARILSDFDRDLAHMTRQTQRYFGDWCDYCGHGDVGYYIAARFVRSMLETRSFDDVIGLSCEKVFELYCEFVRKNL